MVHPEGGINMRRLLITIAVVGLMALSAVTDSHAVRVPARDVAIPVWLGDPDNVDCSRDLPQYEAKVCLILEDGPSLGFALGPNWKSSASQRLRYSPELKQLTERVRFSSRIPPSRSIGR